MVFRSKNDNLVGQLVDLRCKIEPHQERGEVYSLNVELGIFSDEIGFGDFEARISLKRAFLDVDFGGLEIEAGSKYGLDILGNIQSNQLDVERQFSTTIEKEQADQALVDGSLSATGFSVKANEKSNQRNTEKTTVSVTEKEQLAKRLVVVKAIGNDMWRISLPNGEPIDNTLLSNDSLCLLSFSAENRNRRFADVSVVAKQKDIDIDYSGRGFISSLSNNKKKIMNILISKSIDRFSSENNFQGSVVFSRSEISNEE